MGTRSLTHIKKDGETLLTFYRQYDGYPEGMGVDLAEFLDGFEVVNGYGERKPKLANGMGCLAAQLIKELKDDVGNVYIFAADSEDCGEEYTYTIELDSSEPIGFNDARGLLISFDGKKKRTPAEFLAKYKK